MNTENKVLAGYTAPIADVIELVAEQPIFQGSPGSKTEDMVEEDMSGLIGF